MPVRTLVIAAALIGALASTAMAQTATRVNDQGVRQQMEQVQRSLDRFIDTVGPQARTAALQPLLTGTRAAAARMTAAYRPPASICGAEVAEFLKQARALRAALATAPGVAGAEDAWGAAVAAIVRLAQTYHIDWNADPIGWVPSRVCDRELREAAGDLAGEVRDLAAGVGASLKKDQVLDPTEKVRAQRHLAALEESATACHDAIRHDESALTAVNRVVKAAADITMFVDTYPGAAHVRDHWQRASTALDTIAQAFGVSR